MATLLHIDSSVFPGAASASRTVTETFRRTWEEQHPEGTVIYRDLAADPVPHITADVHTAGLIAPDAHTSDQAAAFAERLTCARSGGSPPSRPECCRRRSGTSPGDAAYLPWALGC
jgi:FMN-dependent NADH-azoreductase